MKVPDEPSTESLLRGSIRQPSARFEEALQQIPERADRPGRPAWLPALRPLAIAAALIAATALFLRTEIRQSPAEAQPTVTELQLDPEWIELFSLADSLNGAESLADAEARFALEYYAFDQ